MNQFTIAQKPILLNANHLFVLHKLFLTGIKCSQIFRLAQKIGPAQNILGPVKGQGINFLKIKFIYSEKATKYDIS